MTPLQAICREKCINVSAVARKNNIDRQFLHQQLRQENMMINTLNRVLNMLPLTKAERDEVILAYFKDQTRKEPPKGAST